MQTEGQRSSVGECCNCGVGPDVTLRLASVSKPRSGYRMRQRVPILPSNLSKVAGYPWISVAQGVSLYRWPSRAHREGSGYSSR